MASALTHNELDIAMLLTEGAVAGIAQGGRYGVVSLYTQSPLIWGIHVPAGSQLRRIADLEGATYAISRLGSGSHLMCFVHARENGWPLESLKFVTVRSLEGAIAAFEAGTCGSILLGEVHDEAGRRRRPVPPDRRVHRAVAGIRRLRLARGVGGEAGI